MKRKLSEALIILCCAILFSYLTVYLQVDALGRHYLVTNQVRQHQHFLHGTLGNSWQYRVLPEYLIEGIMAIVAKLGISVSISKVFVLFRCFQNIAIFLLAALYYKKLGLKTYVTLIGLSLLASGMSHSFYDSDLQFNIYFDIIFYLSAGLLVLYKKDAWIIPIVGLAALNRETSGFIPFMLLADKLYSTPRNTISKKVVLITVGALLLYIAIFLSLRCIYPRQELLLSYGRHPGPELLQYNVCRSITWVQLLATLGIVPLMAIFSIRQWPRTLRAFFWLIVPLWFLVHLFTGILAETRLLLVPLVLVFIPGALFGIANSTCPQPDNY